MSYSLRTRYSPDVLLGMSGAILTIPGFFLPILFSQMTGPTGFSYSQWDMIISWWESCRYAISTHDAWLVAIGLFFLVASALPLLAALVGLVAFCLTIIRKRSVRWMLYITGAGAALESLVVLAMFLYISAFPSTQIASGFILLAVGSLFLLFGVLVGEITRKRNAVLPER
ncbi:hypothetical protein [Reticulibacter mediterranei]|nr:hypothetical protein [Reticulibacter mediterranei]